MIDSENIFEIYEEILFRELRPAVLCERLEIEGFEPFELLWEEPNSLQEFINIKQKIGTLNKIGLPFRDYKESEVYFQNPLVVDMDGHTLARFYVYLIQFERKCIQQEVEIIFENGAKTWVKYQLSRIINRLRSLLGDCILVNDVSKNKILQPIDSVANEKLGFEFTCSAMLIYRDGCNVF